MRDSANWLRVIGLSWPIKRTWFRSWSNTYLQTWLSVWLFMVSSAQGCMRKRGYKVTPPFLFKNDCSSLANMASFTSSSLTTILHSLLFLFWGHFWCANNCVFFVLSSLPLSVFSRIILITHLCRIISHLVCLNPIPLSSLARPSFVKLFVFVKEFVYLHSWLVEFIC